MYSRNSLGSYYPIDSAMHRLNPTCKLIMFLISIFLIIFSTSLYVHLFLFALIVVMMLLSYVPLRYYFNTFWSLRYILLIIVFACSSFGVNIINTCAYMLKLIILVEYLNVLAFTTSPSETEYGIEKVLTPFNIFFLPVSSLSMKLNNALRFIPLMLSVEYKILKAQTSRGIDYYHSTIFGRIYAIYNVFENVIEQTKRKNRDIYFSSCLRLYNTKKYRTNYRTNKIGFYDIVFLSFHLLLVYAFIKERGLLWDI